MSKTWFITGSSRGLGRALAEEVLESGDRLVATARRIEGLQDLMTRYGDQVVALPLDVADPQAVGTAVDKAVAVMGRIDVLVNNAGYGTIASLEDISLKEFRDQIETNLFGTVYATKAVIPYMRAQGGGHIIQFSSVGGRIGALGRTAYSAAKWGVEGFSEALAKEVSPLGIKVTIVEPGGFRTGFAAEQTAGPIRQEYQSTVGEAARFQAQYDGKQPGDPARAAKVIRTIAGLDSPPFRLLLGSDAVKAVEQNDLAKTEAAKVWRQLSLSTDFPVTEEASGSKIESGKRNLPTESST